MKTFGTNLTLERKLCKLSQKELADKLGTTQQRVSEWECDKVEPTLYNIIGLIRILNISFEELTEGIDYTNFNR